jgi:biopolymer transport protein ExbB
MEFLKESVDYAIFFILGLMGFVSIWLTIERVMFLRKVNPSDYPTKDEYDAGSKRMTG